MLVKVTVHSSVKFVGDGEEGCPPEAKAAVCVPAGEPPRAYKEFPISPTSVKAVQFQASVLFVTGGDPPKTKPAVCVPETAREFLPVFKVPLNSVHELPAHDSTPV